MLQGFPLVSDADHAVEERSRSNSQRVWQKRTLDCADIPTPEEMALLSQQAQKVPEACQAGDELAGFPLPESGVELSQKQKVYLLQNVETLESLWIKCDRCLVKH
jgi:hypothetical protein